MSNYSNDPRMVRVDFFKESGKWYTTEAVLWIGYDTPLIHNAFEESLKAHFSDRPDRLQGMWAVCLDPCHTHSHPLMMRVP